jgi:hypothetical protein
MLTLMSWSYTPNWEREEQIDVVNGVALTNNSGNSPLGAHVRAFRVAGSVDIEGEEFTSMLTAERKTIGVRPKEILRELVPADQYDRTVAHLQQFLPIVGFVPAQGDNNDA